MSYKVNSFKQGQTMGVINPSNLFNSSVSAFLFNTLDVYKRQGSLFYNTPSVYTIPFLQLSTFTNARIYTGFPPKDYNSMISLLLSTFQKSQFYNLPNYQGLQVYNILFQIHIENRQNGFKYLLIGQYRSIDVAYYVFSILIEVKVKKQPNISLHFIKYRYISQADIVDN